MLILANVLTVLQGVDVGGYIILLVGTFGPQVSVSFATITERTRIH